MFELEEMDTTSSISLNHLPFTTVETGGRTGTFFSGVADELVALLGSGGEVDCFRNGIPSIFCVDPIALERKELRIHPS